MYYLVISHEGRESWCGRAIVCEDERDAIYRTADMAGDVSTCAIVMVRLPGLPLK